MIKVLPFCLFFVLLSPAHAQEQERKLLDRILKPDTTLQSSEQDKKFTPNRSSVDKHATVGTFYLEQKPKSKRFSETQDLSTGEFNSRSARTDGDGQAQRLSQQSATGGKVYHPASKQSETRTAYDANKARAGKAYSGSRPFLDKGKSQKSLNRENPPMTIDQVRDLLNKNK